VQRRFTKRVRGLFNFSYPERLRRLHLPTLKIRRTFLTACLTYKLIHRLMCTSLEEVGLHLSTNRTRAGGVKLVVPRPNCTLFHNSFVFQAVSIWNSLPSSLISIAPFNSFRVALYSHLCLSGEGFN